MISPLGKRIIIQALDDKMASTIAIPEQYRQSQTGVVIGVGNKITSGLKVDDIVLFHPNAAWTNIEHEGEQLRVINDEYLLAVMEEV